MVSLLICTPLRAQDTTPAAVPQRPIAAHRLQTGDLVLERYFPSLLQGQVGLLYLVGDNVQEARVFLGQTSYAFVRYSEREWFAFVIASMDMPARTYALTTVVKLSDHSDYQFDDQFAVESNSYIRQVFEVPSTLGYLINPEVERGEFARIDALVAVIDETRHWSQAAWSLPITSDYSARFGQYRILNDAVQTRHTGWDQRAPVGTPISAMADGVVVFADQLAIRGNYVLINHGWGVYSGYAHLSQLSVQDGQTIMQGQILGLSGNTGRSNGPHLHWEMLVNGEWVDGVLFLEMWLP